MPSYNRIKAQKASPVGTIMPWTGSTSDSALVADAIPKGWIVCNGAQLKAKDYPILAQILGNEYGPVVEPGQPFVGISNSYPSYNDDDVFNLPSLNQTVPIDLEGNLLTGVELSVIGQYVSKNGFEGNQPLTNVLSYIDAEFITNPAAELSGKIKGITLEEPSYFDTIRTIPRKLGVEHTATHTHPRPSDGTVYPSVELGGAYVGLFEAGYFETQGNEYSTGSDVGYSNAEPLADRFDTGEVFWTAYDPAATSLVTCDNHKHFGSSSDVIPLVPSIDRNIPSYGQTTGAPGAGGYADNNSCVSQVQQAAVTAPFLPPGTYLGQTNYYKSDQVPLARRGGGATPPVTDPNDYYGAPDTAVGRDFPYPTTLNHSGDAFTDATLGSHNHFTIDITMTNGQMNLPSTILINNMTTGNIEPIDVDRSLSVQINPNTPSLVTLYIIRAY